MVLYLGWIVAAFFIGFNLAWFLQRRKKTIWWRVSQIPLFRGNTYTEVVRELDCEPQMTVKQADDRIVRTWRDENSYSLSLLFDAQDWCLGVLEEHYGRAYKEN